MRTKNNKLKKGALILPGILSLLLIVSCNRGKFKHDASGVFEATEILVSAEASGKIEALALKEGDFLTLGQYVGYIDSTQLYLQKLQLQATKKAVSKRRPDIGIQISSTKEQIRKAEIEKRRVENLFRADAATQKQVDDAEAQLKVLQNTLAAQVNSLSASVNSLTEEEASYEVQIARIEDLLSKTRIINPAEGVVLSKYAEEKEIAVSGRPLYKIADTRNLFLRAYVVAAQLEDVKLGQEVTVWVSYDGKNEKAYPGKVAWISDKAEFTPKTIQTKDERQNLVYAVKIAVENADGLLKIGMYADVAFSTEQR